MDIYCLERPHGDFPNYIVWKEIAPPKRIVWMYYGMGKDDPHPVKTTLALAEAYVAAAAV